MAQTRLTGNLQSCHRLFHVSCSIANAITIEIGHFIGPLLQRHTFTRSIHTNRLAGHYLWLEIVLRTFIARFEHLSTATFDAFAIL